MLLQTFTFHLRARNLSPRTITATEDYLRPFLALHDPLAVTRRDVEDYLGAMSQRCRPDTDLKGGNGDGEFTFTTSECLISVEVDSSEFDTLYVGLWIDDEYDDRDMSNSGYVIVSGSCL